MTTRVTKKAPAATHYWSDEHPNVGRVAYSMKKGRKRGAPVFITGVYFFVYASDPEDTMHVKRYDIEYVRTGWKKKCVNVHSFEESPLIQLALMSA